VVEDPQHPAVGVVAIATFLAQATLMLILRLVAGEALDIRFMKLAAQVASFTGGHTVDTDERKTGDVVLEKDPLIPRVFIVAIAAVLSQLLLMHIDCPMTVDTGGVFKGIYHGGAMAGAADQFLVLPLENKVGVLIVVEVALLPTFNTVAILALFTVSAFVFIVFFMASETGLLQLFRKRPLCMTGIALRLLVLSL
jgi:hypothetical protein